jgi:hypothetical protein
VEEWMRKKRAPSLYRLEAGDGRGTRGVALTALAEVSGGRSAGEASPLTWRRLPKRRSGASRWRASKDASTQDHCQTGPTKRPPEASRHFARSRSVCRDTSEMHILARFASPRTDRSLYIAPLEQGPDAFFGPMDGKGRSTFVRLHRGRCP